MPLRLAILGSIVGALVALSVPAFAAVSHNEPRISPSEVTFHIPTGLPAATWTLKLFSEGTPEGTTSAPKGELTLPVPATPSCQFQADVVYVPVGGTQHYFSGSRATVPGCGPPQTIAGDIYLCTGTSTQTTTEVLLGTLAATGPETVASQANPLLPAHVAAGVYSMTAGAPSGYIFVGCGGTATISTVGDTASESVTVPTGGAGMGIFYVEVAPTSSSGGGTSGGGSTSSGGSSPKSAVTSPATKTASAQVTSTPTPATSSSLAFTGMDTEPLLLSGLAALALGALALATSRVRRRVQGAASRSSRP
jgi:hypothetical protein